MIGGSIGIAILETGLTQNTQIVHSRLIEQLRPDNPSGRGNCWCWEQPRSSNMPNPAGQPLRPRIRSGAGYGCSTC